MDETIEKSLMSSIRRPRFNRAPVSPVRLTERDLEIIRQVHRHRFLSSRHIAALVGGSRQQVLRRLQLLYHHSFLERPRMQIEYFNSGAPRHIVYGLGDAAPAILRSNGIPPHGARYSDRNHAVGRFFLRHTLLISDIMVAIDLACRKNGQIRLLYGEDIIFSDRTLFRWKVSVRGAKLSAIPDRVFALEPVEDSRDRKYIFLEADRGTMPVIRTDLSQTSFYKKLLAYEGTWRQKLHHSLFGINRFQVITVTTSEERVRSLVEACSKLKSGLGLFLFGDETLLAKDVLSRLWHTGRPGETASLID